MGIRLGRIGPQGVRGGSAVFWSSGMWGTTARGDRGDRGLGGAISGFSGIGASLRILDKLFGAHSLRVISDKSLYGDVFWRGNWTRLSAAGVRHAMLAAWAG